MSRVVGHQRAHLSIGEVLSLLQDEFPDVTISKIRFLESQGLLDPERTPSGYRKFYEYDIERLRWILRQQKDHYLPLKVIKDRLDQSPGGVPDSSGDSGDSSHSGEDNAQGALPLSPQSAPAETKARTQQPAEQNSRAAKAPAAPPAPRPVAPRPIASAPSPSPAQPGRRGPAQPARLRPTTSSLGASGRPRTAAAPAARSESSPVRPAPAVEVPRSSSGFDPSSDSITLDIDELAEASGLSLRDIRDLERFGLIEPREVGDGASYDGDALVIARAAAGFLQHGIEARHMRTYKVAADREAGLFEQIVSPVLKQRNPEARTRATRTVTELIRLGEVMRGVLLRRELRDHLG